MQIKQWDGVIQSYLDSNRKSNATEKIGIMVKVTKPEAIRIIRSLSGQMEEYDPNYGRLEEFTPEGYDFFSIGVIDGNALFHGEEITDNAGCDSCGIHDRIEGEKLCQDCLDDDICDDDCFECGGNPETCGCWNDDNDYDYDNYDDYDDDYSNEIDCACNTEVVTPPLNAFARARYLKAQGGL